MSIDILLNPHCLLLPSILLERISKIAKDINVVVGNKRTNSIFQVFYSVEASIIAIGFRCHWEEEGDGKNTER